MDEKLKKGLLKGGLIGVSIGIITIFSGFVISSLAEGLLVLEKIGAILLFTFGLPYLLAMFTFQAFGLVTSPYLFYHYL